MKRAASAIGFAGFFEFDPAANELYQIDAIQYLVNGVLWNCHIVLMLQQAG